LFANGVIPNPAPGDTWLFVEFDTAAANGNATITIEARDQGGATVTDSFVITLVEDLGPQVVQIIPDVNVSEDAPNSTIDLHAIFYDVEDTPDKVSYSIVGNTNPALFTSVTINDGSTNPGVNGPNLTLDYAANMNGTSYITVRATDTAGNSNDTGFYVNVAPVNDAPTATPIANVTVNQNAPNTVINLYDHFADIETADAQLTYSVYSNNNPALFQSIDITNPQQFTLDYSAAGYGSANITIRAVDASGGYVDNSFTVVVNQVNQLPTLDGTGIPDITVGRNSVDTVLNLDNYFGDTETADSNLRYEIISNSNPNIFSSVALTGGGHYLTLNYNDYAYYGYSYITVRAYDSSGSYIQDTFKVTITTTSTTTTPASSWTAKR
jgi:hypothetical protein